MKSDSRRNIALLLLFVSITGLVISFGENALCAGEAPGAHDKAHASAAHASEQIHGSSCPGTPSPQHDPGDHFCTGGCGCPCQAPLAPSPAAVSYSPSSTDLYHVEVFRHVPEVYLSLYVPPDSAII